MGVIAGRRGFLRAVLGTAVAPCVVWGTGCDDKSPTGPATQASAGGGGSVTPVKLTLDWKPEPEFGGFYAAKLSGAFTRNGLDADIRSAGEGAPTWQLVARGQTDFATTAADQVLIARAGGADVVALFAVYQTAPQGVMTHAARGFNSLADVFASDGTLAAENNSWLRYCSNKYAPLKVKVTGYSGGIATFLAKQDHSQQCFMFAEPVLANRQGANPRTFLIADSGFNPYTTVVITRGELLREKPQLVTAMAAACREGWKAYLADAAPANALMAGLNKDMDPETFTEGAKAQAPLIDTGTSPLGAMTKDRWETLAGQLFELKVIEKAPPADACFLNP